MTSIKDHRGRGVASERGTVRVEENLPVSRGVDNNGDPFVDTRREASLLARPLEAATNLRFLLAKRGQEKLPYCETSRIVDYVGSIFVIIIIIVRRFTAPSPVSDLGVCGVD